MTAADRFDPRRIVDVLDRHHDNFERLSGALCELYARIRVHARRSAKVFEPVSGTGAECGQEFSRIQFERR